MTREVDAAALAAHWQELMDRVAETGEPLLVTRNGEPFVEIVKPREGMEPRQPREKRKSLVGALKGSVTYMGDLETPVDDFDWEDETLKEWDELHRQR